MIPNFIILRVSDVVNWILSFIPSVGSVNENAFSYLMQGFTYLRDGIAFFAYFFHRPVFSFCLSVFSTIIVWNFWNGVKNLVIKLVQLIRG